MEERKKVTLIQTPNETKVLIGDVDVTESVISAKINTCYCKTTVELKMQVEKLLIEDHTHD